jgi:hypothetical protein
MSEVEIEEVKNPELHPDWAILPVQVKAKILGKECFGDFDKLDGNSILCQKCPLWSDCLSVSFRQMLSVYDAIHCSQRVEPGKNR